MSDRPEAPDIELSLPLDTLCLIFAKARQFAAKTGSSDPAADALDEDDLGAAALEHRPSDPVEHELRTLIADLSEDAQIDLVTLMWMGRDDAPLSDWPRLRALAAEQHTPRTPRYLCGTPLLSDYLIAAMARFGQDCADVLRGHA